MKIKKIVAGMLVGAMLVANTPVYAGGKASSGGGSKSGTIPQGNPQGQQQNELTTKQKQAIALLILLGAGEVKASGKRK